MLVLGVGNVLLQDEGVGVHVARHLEQGNGLPRNVRVVDGGTGGFHLMGLLSEHDPVVFVDATLDGRPPGSLAVRQPRFASDFPRVLSAHDIGLRDLIEAVALLGHLPRMYLVTVSVAAGQPPQVGLSPPVAGALEGAVQEVQRIVQGELRPEARPG